MSSRLEGKFPVGEGQEGEDSWPGRLVLLSHWECLNSQTQQVLPISRPGVLWGALVEFPVTLEFMAASLLVMAASQSLHVTWQCQALLQEW